MRGIWGAILVVLMPNQAQAQAQARAQATPYTVFDRTPEGWSIVRRADGCFMSTTYDGPGETDFSVFYNVEDADTPVTILIGNGNWTVRDERATGYRLEFAGSHDWTDLSALTFRSDGKGIISIMFANDAAANLLADVWHANGLNIYRNEQVIDRLSLRGSGNAVRRLLDCVRTFPHRGIPRNPFQNDVPVPERRD
jgi:hypothetical protein